MSKEAEIILKIEQQENLLGFSPEETRDIPFLLKVSILQIARNPDESLIVVPEKEIALLLRHQGSIIETPSLDLRDITDILPRPERDFAEACLNKSNLHLPRTYLFASPELSQIFVIIPPPKNPFKEAEKVLPTHDLEVAQKQIEEANAPLVIARHEIDKDSSFRENRWILMIDGNGKLRVTSPKKLTWRLIDVKTYYETHIDGKGLEGIEPSQRAKLVSALLTETLARSQVVFQQQGVSSPVERAKDITSPMTPQNYREEIRRRYMEAGVGNIFSEELEIQLEGIKDAMFPILNPEMGYKTYLEEAKRLGAERIKEFYQIKIGFEESFSNYSGYSCRLVEGEQGYECEVVNQQSQRVVQKIAWRQVEERLKEGKSGLRVVWIDSEGNEMEKPIDRKFIGISEKLRTLNHAIKATQVEILDFDTWKKQVIATSALASGYYSLPYGVRKGLNMSEENLEEVFATVTYHNADQTLREHARLYIAWLETTGDKRLASFIEKTGEVSPAILGLKSEYSAYVRKQIELQSLRQRVESQEPVYDSTKFLVLNGLDPRRAEDRRKALDLYRESGVIVVENQSIEEVSRRFPQIGRLFEKDINIDQPTNEMLDIYNKPIETKEDYETFLKQLPLSQTEFDLLLKEGEEEENLDVLARAALIYYKILWRAHIKSKETDIYPQTSLNYVRTIAKHIVGGEPIPISMFYACCESTHPFKVTQQVPDISEYYFLRKLEILSRVTKIVHEPGIKWILVNEATLAGELIGSTLEIVNAFASDMQLYLEDHDFNSISIVDMRDVIIKPFDQLQEKELDFGAIDEERLLDVWRELSKIGLVDGGLDKDRLTETLEDSNLFDRLISAIALKMNVPNHRTDAFATSCFMGDFDLDLTPEQLLSLSGRHIAKTDAFKTEIDADKIKSEVMGKWVTKATENARFFDSHMQLRPLIKALGKAGLVDLPEALSDETISATITRKENKLVISPADNGLFPTHGYGCLTTTGKMHVVPAHEILSHPNRYVLITIGDRIIAVLDTPDEFIEDQARRARLSTKNSKTTQSNTVFDSRPN